MIRYAAIAAVGLGLAACTQPTTEKVGALIDADKLQNPAGQNSFRIVFDPQNPGIPASVYAASGKDDEGMALSVVYRMPDGSETTWNYQVAVSKGSEQTAALMATVAAVAELEAQTGQKLGSEAISAISSSVRAALGLPG